MGISIQNYILKGIYFSDEDTSKLSEKEYNTLFEDEIFSKYVYHMNPMSDSSFVFGEDIFISDDGRYDDNSIPLINILDYCSDNEVFTQKVIPIMPPFLKDIYDNGVGKYGLWIATVYS